MRILCVHSFFVCSLVVLNGVFNEATPVTGKTFRRALVAISILPATSRHTFFTPPRKVEQLERRWFAIDPACRTWVPLFSQGSLLQGLATCGTDRSTRCQIPRCGTPKCGREAKPADWQVHPEAEICRFPAQPQRTQHQQLYSQKKWYANWYHEVVSCSGQKTNRNMAQTQCLWPPGLDEAVGIK